MSLPRRAELTTIFVSQGLGQKTLSNLSDKRKLSSLKLLCIFSGVLLLVVSTAGVAISVVMVSRDLFVRLILPQTIRLHYLERPIVCNHERLLAARQEKFNLIYAKCAFLVIDF
jgi:hypothetical protein